MKFSNSLALSNYPLSWCEIELTNESLDGLNLEREIIIIYLREVISRFGKSFVNKITNF